MATSVPKSKSSVPCWVWFGGYVVEVAVPLKEAGLDGRSKLGLNVLSDDIDGGYRQHTSMTYYKDANYWNSPKTLGTLILNGK
ncbi:MAG: sugar-binding protein [Verrucomicrobiota bacterium]